MSSIYPSRVHLRALIVCLLCLSISASSSARIKFSGQHVQPLLSAGREGNGGGAGLSTQSTTQPTGQLNALPIVFVPGTAGSELRLSNPGQGVSDELNWIGLSSVRKKNIALAPLDADGKDLPGNEVSAPNILTAVSIPVPAVLQGLLRSHLGYSPSTYDLDIYANFYAWAQKTFPARFYVAPYDWRKGAGDEASRKLDEVVTRALKETGQQKVVMVAHSLGGLVSRDYISGPGKGKVAALIAVGTPWLGTPKAARALLFGYNFDVGIVSDSDKKVKIQDLPQSFKTEVCSGSKCQYLYRISFFESGSLRAIAKNYPALYLQLPTSDFMAKYGQQYGEEFRSVIWGKNSWDEVERFYRDENNSKLYNAARQWRETHLSGDSYDVRHYLIGGVYSPSCKEKKTKEEKKWCAVANRMDMQMAQTGRIEHSKSRTKTIARLDKAAQKLFKLNLHEDRFVATDSSYEWGDGTVPILSATAGEYLRGETVRRNAGKAKEYLGADTEVEAVRLSPRHAHASLLNAPRIREKILAIYNKENKENIESGANHIFTDGGKEVESIRFEIRAQPNGKVNGITIRLFEGAGDMIPASAYLHNPTATLTFEYPLIFDPNIYAPKEVSTGPASGINRNSLTTDLPGRSFSIVKRSGNEAARDLVITGISVYVNGALYFEDKTTFVLSSTVPRVFAFPALQETPGLPSTP
jgi:pimeloyl-ACP methyl ester carboxylesterase